MKLSKLCFLNICLLSTVSLAAPLQLGGAGGISVGPFRVGGVAGIPIGTLDGNPSSISSPSSADASPEAVDCEVFSYSNFPKDTFIPEFQSVLEGNFVAKFGLQSFRITNISVSNAYTHFFYGNDRHWNFVFTFSKDNVSYSGSFYMNFGTYQNPTGVYKAYGVVNSVEIEELSGKMADGTKLLPGLDGSQIHYGLWINVPKNSDEGRRCTELSRLHPKGWAMADEEAPPMLIFPKN